MELQRQGLRFEVRVEGPANGPMVVLLHGFPQDPSAWDGIWPTLTRAGYRVVIPAQRGCSPLARPRSRWAYRMPELIADVLAMADQAGAERFHLVGHDLGAMVAWRIGAWHPQRLHSLTVLANPHPLAIRRAALTSFWQLRRLLYVWFFQLPWLPERLLLARDGRWLLTTLVRTGLNESTAASYTRRIAESGALRAALGWYRAIPLSRGKPPRGQVSPRDPDRVGRSGSLRSGRVPVPTLFVWGARDAFCGRKAMRETSRWVSGQYVLAELPDVSHWVPEQAPEQVAALLQRHLKANTATP